MSELEWTTEDQEVAAVDGWRIHITRDVNSVTILRSYEVETIGSDRQAFKHVRKMAAAGSPLHQKALRFFEENRDATHDHIHAEDCTEYYCNLSDENCPVGIGYMETARSVNRDGVHASHCCKHCGCKYGEEDCPVVLGRVESKYKCEESHSKTFTMTESEVKQAIAQLEIYRNYFHMPEETFYTATPFKRMLKFHKDMN